MRKAKYISPKKRNYLKINTALRSLSGHFVYLTKDVKRIRTLLKQRRHALMYGTGIKTFLSKEKETKNDKTSFLP